jgi:hypothetical protein
MLGRTFAGVNYAGDKTPEPKEAAIHPGQLYVGHRSVKVVCETAASTSTLTDPWPPEILPLGFIAVGNAQRRKRIMSLWRREASRLLPEFQKKIAAPDLFGPSDLWMDLTSEFLRLARERPVQAELIGRIWEYAKWSLSHEDDKVQFAVTAHFVKRLFDTRHNREVLPAIIGEKDYKQFFLPQEPS